MFELLRNCGWTSFLALLLGTVALSLTATALLLAFLRRHRAAAMVAGIGLFITGLTAFAGFGGTLYGRKVVGDAVAVASIGKVDRQRILIEGFEEARDCSRLGLALTGLPFLLGAVASGLSLFGKRPPERPGATEPGSPLGPAPQDPGPNVPVVLLGAACAFTGLLATGAMASASPPGAQQEPELWRLLSLTERALDPSEASVQVCKELELELLTHAIQEVSGRCVARVELSGVSMQAADLPRAAERCVRADLERGGSLDGLSCSASLATVREPARTELTRQIAARKGAR